MFLQIEELLAQVYL